ncbi:MAG: exosortase [Rhodospirillales bacterium]|nr:exosortase [Rhodospirillales bacterium]
MKVAASRWPGWFTLAAGLLVLGFVFHAEIGAAINVWLHSTAYNHCFLILPMAAWLAWQRRERLGRTTIQPTLLALPAGLVLGMVWFLADRLGIMEGRQLAAMSLVQLLFLSVLGWALYRAMAAPLLYLFFLVPFGGFLVPLLQRFTTLFVVHGLDVIGVPNFNVGNDIEIPQGVFRIAEACAGLRFLIAAIAFSVFYACIIYRNPGRRILFILVSLFVPVIANGFRALGIVWLGYMLGSARAAATDHVLYGYLFFSIVLLLLIMLGLLFRQDHLVREVRSEPAKPEASAGLARSLPPAAAVVVLAALFPMLAGGIDRAAAATHPVLQASFPGCTRQQGGVTLPRLVAAGGALERFACEDHTLALTLAVFPPRSDPRLILDSERALSGEDTREAEMRTLHVAAAVPKDWQLVFIQVPPAATASALWIGGQPAANDLRTRLKQALASLLGGRKSPLVVVIETAGPPAEAEARLASFLAAGGASPAKLASFQH